MIDSDIALVVIIALWGGLTVIRVWWGWKKRNLLDQYNRFDIGKV